MATDAAIDPDVVVAIEVHRLGAYVTDETTCAPSADLTSSMSQHLPLLLLWLLLLRLTGAPMKCHFSRDRFCLFARGEKTHHQDERKTEEENYFYALYFANLIHS